MALRFNIRLLELRKIWLTFSLAMPSSVSILALAAASVAGYHLLGSLFRKWAVAHFTVLNELKGLGDARGAQERLKGTAVICGGRYGSSQLQYAAV